MRTTTRIVTVTVVALLLVGLAVAALAGPRFERGLQERDQDRLVEQVEADDPDEVTLRERDRDRLRIHDPEVRQDRDRLRIHDPECDRLQEQDGAAHRHEHGTEHEPVRARERRSD